MPEPIPAGEPTTVQLTRMEGVLNLVAYQVTGLIERVDRHEAEIRILTSETQKLASDAKANIQTVESTAKALREAKESEEAATRASLARSEQTWSPFARTLAVVAVLASLLSVYLIAVR